MMQLDALVLYARDGREREIRFRPGRLNVITGDSKTGKSSLLNILRFCMGDDSPHAPRGPVQESVAWYGLLAHVGETRFFIGRPAPPPNKTTGAAMLLVGVSASPAFSQLTDNATAHEIRQYLGNLIGITDNEFVPPPGHSRRALAASFVHSLYYCFQGQGEIANPDILFHHQNREFQAQTIRDTLPYFLGVQGLEDLRKRQNLADLRRRLRLLNGQIRDAESEQDAGLGRAGTLLSEARDVGLLVQSESPDSLDAARALLQAVADSQASVVAHSDAGAEFDRLQSQRRQLSSDLGDVNEQIRGLDEFANVENQYEVELQEQAGRLSSIGLIPQNPVADARCALCDQSLDGTSGTAYLRVQAVLGQVDRSIDLTQRERPQIEGAREQLVAERNRLRTVIADTAGALDAIAEVNEAAVEQLGRINTQSYVRGRIAQYLDTSAIVEPVALQALRTELDDVTGRIARLEEELDVATLHSLTISLLHSISRTMSSWAETLDLEHASGGARIDPDRLTIVADTTDGPAYMDHGEIGSAMNWVGYHLTAYLALQEFFIAHERPVPSFLFLDQPSQAFFPRDRAAGDETRELSDTDRENTKRLYRLMYDVVAQLEGRLQVIAVEHADFDEDWFRESVIERWRDGTALIPNDWRSQKQLPKPQV